VARSKADIKAQPREVSRLREQLDEWRKEHARGTAIPQTLWAAAGRMAQRHGVHVTARALGLEYNKLKRAGGGPLAPAGGAAMGPAARQAVKFIELTGALPTGPSACRLWLRGPGGQAVQLEMAGGAAAEVLLQLCRSGWGAT